jgi:ParB-like chromosome segregation protein Spo0J
MNEPKYHPACLLLPEMTEHEYRELVDDIRDHGQRERIRVLPDGRIFDGRHRWRACQELGIEPKIARHLPPYEGAELDRWVAEFVISANLHRRHLTTQQRAAVAAELATMQHGGDRKSERIKASNDAMPDAKAAELMRVSERSVERAKRRMRTDPEAHAKAKAGRLARRKQPLSKPQKMRRQWDEMQKAKRERVEGLDYEIREDLWGFKHREPISASPRSLRRNASRAR